MTARRTLGRWVALVAAGLLAPPAARAKPAHVPLNQRIAAPANPVKSALIYLSDDGRAVYIVGAIMEDSFLKFDALLQTAPQVKTVVLASPGGLTIEARLIAALVRKRGLSTYVASYCASACTQVFVSGRERVLGQGAELGFHQAIGVDERGRTTAVAAVTGRKLTQLSVFGVGGNDTLRLAYESAGIAHDFIARALARKHDDMWLPTPAELSAAHVISRQVAGAEFGPPRGGKSVDALRALLAEKPMWLSAADKLPAAYALALHDVWRRVNSGTELGLAVSSARSSLVVAAWPMIAQADDTVADRMLTLYAQSARGQRAADYPLCQSADLVADTPLDPIDQAFDAEEDELLVALFAAPRQAKPISGAAAEQVFANDVVPQLLRGYAGADFKTKADSCRFGFALFEVIDELPAKKRLRAYRAFLSLPGFAGAAASASALTKGR